MSPVSNPDKRIAIVRLLVWVAMAVAALTVYGDASTWAWRAPAFAALYTAISLVFSRNQVRNRISDMIDIGVDIVSATMLIAFTGGFSSPFSALFFLTTGEAYVLLGTRAGIWAAIAAALLGLVNLRSGVNVTAAVGYGFAAGLLVLSSILLSAAESAGISRRNTLMKVRTVEDVEAQVVELEEQNRKLKATYRELNVAAKDQKAKMDDLVAGQRLVASVISPEDAPKLHERLLKELATQFDAGAAAIWIGEERGDWMRVHSTFGPLAPMIRAEPITMNEEMTPSAVRHACEEKLRASAPINPPARRPAPAPAAEDILDPAEEERLDVLGISLREDQRLLGIIALCNPRQGSFPSGSTTRLNALGPMLSLSVQSVLNTEALQKTASVSGLLYELSNLGRSAESAQAFYDAVLEIVASMVSYENCTVFRFLSRDNRLVPKATRGQVVNLISHVAFEKGSGITGWVAQEGKQIFLADIEKEPGLLNMELIPPRVRSFVAVPILQDKELLGVLSVSHSLPNAFTHDDARTLGMLAGQIALSLPVAESPAAPA